jgi:hypothetical protein
MYVLKERKEAGARRQLRKERVIIFYNNFSRCEVGVLLLNTRAMHV